MRRTATLAARALIAVGMLFAAGTAAAQVVDVPSGYTGAITAKNVSGGLSHLPDGDLLAFAADFASGPGLYRFDANGDGLPTGGAKLLAQFDSSVFPDFVEVAPGGRFALAGLSGSSDDILRIDLATDAVTPYFELPGNYDLIFINDAFAYVSANPNGFDPNGANEISLVELSATPVLTTVLSVTGTPSGPIALNAAGDLYYISGTFAFPAPPLASTLYRFTAADLAVAAATEIPLSTADADAQVSLSGGFDMVFHPLGSGPGELFVSDFSNVIQRIDEATLTGEAFAAVTDPAAPSITYLSLFRGADFDATGPTQAELAAALALDFFSSNKLLQIRPATYVPAEPVGTDEFGFCRAGEPDCFHQTLLPSACVGVNGFLSQVNIATVANLQGSTLNVSVKYFDSSGVERGAKNTSIGASLKFDFLINELGLQPDTIGTVCVTTDGANGSWTGGVAVYKPDTRNGVKGFGDGFDFALFYPFLNPFRTAVTVPLNTYHLGTDPFATVANWIAITDAERDGIPLRGSLTYFDDLGAVKSVEAIEIPDGARRDFAGHVGIGGVNNWDAIGLATFTPELKPDATRPRFYLTVTRYFYDCPGSSCSNFLTAFNLPYRPGTVDAIHGGVSTANGEISIVELNNVSAVPADAAFNVLAANGVSRGTPLVPVPPRATRHLILNAVGQSGFLESNTTASASMDASGSYLSATSLFYKLSAGGKLEYAYAAPFAGTAGQAQLSQFNSFISQSNTPEVFNSGSVPVIVNVDFLSYTGANVGSTSFTLAPNATRRVSELNIAPNTYGTVLVQGNNPGLVVRNYIRRGEEYTLSFAGQ